MPQDSSGVPTPSILGPEVYSRLNADPPLLSVDLGGVRYFAVELATDPTLFDPSHQAMRNDSNFFASWSFGLIGPLENSTYAMPQDAWVKLRDKNAIFYRVLSSSAGDSWQTVKASTAGDLSSAQKIQITTDPAPPSLRSGRASRPL